jgi:hypothetical protein
LPGSGLKCTDNNNQPTKLFCFGLLVVLWQYEKQDLKSARMTEVADSADFVWKSAKSVMGWKTLELLK